MDQTNRTNRCDSDRTRARRRCVGALLLVGIAGLIGASLWWSGEGNASSAPVEAVVPDAPTPPAREAVQTAREVKPLDAPTPETEAEEGGMARVSCAYPFEAPPYGIASMLQPGPLRYAGSLAQIDDGTLTASVEADQPGAAMLMSFGRRFSMKEGVAVIRWPAAGAGSEAACTISEDRAPMVGLLTDRSLDAAGDDDLVFFEGCDSAVDDVLNELTSAADVYSRVLLLEEESCEVRAVRVADGRRADGPWVRIERGASGDFVVLDVPDMADARPLTDEELEELEEFVDDRRDQLEVLHELAAILEEARDPSDERAQARTDFIDEMIDEREGSVTSIEDQADLAWEVSDEEE